MNRFLLLKIIFLSLTPLILQATPGTLPLVTAKPLGVNKNDQEYKAGYLNVTKAPYNADPSGVEDATQAIQDAINDARDYHLVCFLPSGTYRITDTLIAMQKGKRNSKDKWINERTKPCVIVGSKIGPRPVLKLDTRAPGFTSGSWKAAVIIWTQSEESTDPSTTQNNENFNQLFSGIDINLGTGNKKAVGIWFGGSQGSSLENVKIYSDDNQFEYGMYSLPGQGGGTFNVEVVGGRFGFLGVVKTRYPVLVGCRFINQQVAPLKYSGGMPIVLVGCHIKNDSDVPIIADDSSGHQRYSFIDCIVESTGTFVDNSARKNIYMENVYMKGVSTIIKRGSNQWKINKTSEWTRVDEFSYCFSGNGKNILDGSKNTNEIRNKTESAGEPPEDLLTRHIWDEEIAPSFEDADAVNVKTDLGANNAVGDGKANDTAALQFALANYDKVFLPKGIYRITDSLVLRSNTQFFGVPKVISRVSPRSNWDPDTNTPLIMAKDDPTARTVISSIYIDLHPDRPNFTALQWRAGRQSVVNQVLIGIELRSDGRVNAKNHMFHIQGSGGGRWRTTCGAWQMLSDLTKNQNTRLLLVENTIEPLHMYGLNTERSFANVQSEIRDSKNVSIYYYKSEVGSASGGQDAATTLQIENSENIAIYGISGSINVPGQLPIVDLIESDKVRVIHVRSFETNNNALTIREKFGGNTSSITTDTTLAMLKRGDPVRITDGMIGTVPPPVSADSYFFEMEALTVSESSGENANTTLNSNASGGAFLYFHANNAGDFVTFAVDVQKAGSYQINAGVGPMPAAGIVDLKIDGVSLNANEDLYSSDYSFEERRLGSYAFITPGIKQFRFEVIGDNPASSGNKLRLDYIRFVTGESEMEVLPIAATSGKSDNVLENANASGGKFVKYASSEVGDYIDFEVSVAAGEHNVFVDVGPTSNSGIVQMSVVGGGSIGLIQDLYRFGSTFEERNFGAVTFATGGTKILRFAVTGKNAASSGSIMRLDRLQVVPVPDNAVPTIEPVPDKTVEEGCLVVVRLNASDSDPDTSLVFSGVSLPPFVTLQDNGDGTGVVIAQPGIGEVGEYNVSIVVDDGTDMQTASFTISVVDS